MEVKFEHADERKRGDTARGGDSDDALQARPNAPPHPVAPDSPVHKKDWALTREAFDRLLACLDTDRERAGVKYETVRRKLVKFFEWRGAEFPEEHADEAINRVARKIVEGEEIRDFNHYVGGVARLLLMEIFKRRHQERAALERFPAPELPAEESVDTGPRVKCFEICMDALAAENRELIVGYYREEKRNKIEHRKELARRLGIPLNALRIRTHRIRAKLEECVHKCVEQPPR